MKIVAVITGQNLNKELQSIKKYKDYIYAVEIRADFIYPQFSQIKPILRKIKTFIPSAKTILTFRWLKEGGKINIPEIQRKKQIIEIIKENQKNIQFVDIEYLSPIFDSIVKAVKQYNKNIIISCHFNNLTSTQKIKNTLKHMFKYPNHNAILKLVFYSSNLKQYFEILRYVYSINRNFARTTIFTIGPTALLTRLISAILSMSLIYTASYTPAITTQPTLEQFIKAATKLGLILGHKNKI